ncbi:MAG: hypothetical protein IT438_15480 [Phycisphaerales bacterium]|nr:hypothetical protein [Phycisphaerales bacterium]
MLRTGLFFLCVLAAALVGCSADTTSASLRVLVADASSQAPIAGAEVIAETPSRDHPFSIQTLFGETGPVRTSASTDSAGVALVEFIPGRPVRIGVIAPGYAIVMQLVEEAWRGPVELTADSEVADAKRLRVRAVPVGTIGPAEDDSE